METKCLCGKPLHYKNPDIQRNVERLVKEKGEFIRISAEGFDYMVPRHYIALHGLRTDQLTKLPLIKYQRKQVKE